MEAAGESTSERGADSAETHVRGIFDEHGRLMVFMTHNTDISDTWEREAKIQVITGFHPRATLCQRRHVMTH